MVPFINMRHVLAMGFVLSNSSRVVLTVLICFLTAPLLAQPIPAPLTSNEIRSKLFGQYLIGEYDTGQSWSEQFNKDATTLYSEGGRSLNGKLTFKRNLACFTYPDDDEITGDCFEVWQRGHNCFDFYSEQSSAGPQERQFGQGWQARAWIAGRDDTCVVDRIA